MYLSQGIWWSSASNIVISFSLMIKNSHSNSKDPAQLRILSSTASITHEPHLSHHYPCIFQHDFTNRSQVIVTELKKWQHHRSGVWSWLNLKISRWDWRTRQKLDKCEVFKPVWNQSVYDRLDHAHFGIAKNLFPPALHHSQDTWLLNAGPIILACTAK